MLALTCRLLERLGETSAPLRDLSIYLIKVGGTLQAMSQWAPRTAFDKGCDIARRLCERLPRIGDQLSSAGAPRDPAVGAGRHTKTKPIPKEGNRVTSNRPAVPLLQGFPPVINKVANTLILGTMPGEESLRMNQYYGNPRNAFWRIMSNLLVIPEDLAYEERTASLRQHQIALWDVIRACEREGSLDAKIRQETIQENDFVSLFRENPNISRVFFNGARAEKEYLKRVLPKVTGPARNLKLARLPSTSPAMARLSFDEKAYAWSEIIRQT